MSTHYLKIPKLKTIVDDNDLNCEKKLEKIRSLIGESNPILADGAPKGSSLEVVPPSTSTSADKFDAVLKEITSVGEKKLATSLLQEIEKSSLITWSPETLEISIDGTPVKYSNIAYLVKRVVSSFPASFPLGIVLFCDALLKIKAPLTLVRNGDVKEILENLQRIKEVKDGNVGEGEKVKEVGDDQEKNPESTLKRQRVSDDEDDFSPQEKRLRNEEAGETLVPETSVRRSFDLPSEKLDKLRRSPRLRKEISEAWKTIKDGKDGKGNSRVRNSRR